MRNGTKTQSATVYCVFLWVDILDAGCFRPSVSNLMTSPSWYIPESTLKIPHTSWSNRSSCAICKSWSHVFCKEVAMPSPHPPSPQKQPWQPSACGPAWARLEKPWRRPCLHLPRPTCPGFIYELGKGISHEKWGFMVVGGGGRGGDGWRVTGEEVLLLLLLMMMMMMMMMMLVMIVVMSVVVVVLLTIISNNADLKIMLHWWGIIDLSLGLKNIMNNVPLEKHIVPSEVRLAYLPTWCSISIAWKKGIPTHFQNHPITRSYRYPSSRYFQQCMGMRSSIAGSNDLNSSASVVIPEKNDQ